MGQDVLAQSLHGGSAIALDVPQVRSVVTPIPGSRSLALARRRDEAVPAGISATLPVFVERAAGGVVIDVDGNSLIDLGSGIAVTNVGNAAPAVVARVLEQAARFTHTCFLLTHYEPYVEVCEALNRITPGHHEKRTALFSTGAEAVENAVKYARAATGRPAVVVVDHAFHGRTNLALAMTAKAMPYKHSFGPFAGEIYRVATSYPYREPAEITGEQAAARAIDEIERQVGSAAVAALVIEPIQGEGGFIVPAPGFLPALASWCRQHGVLFVADEIQTGFARTGSMFACEHEDVVPDLITTAKGLAGGLPLAAVTGRAEVMDVAHPGGIGGTYAGNPIACAAALGSLEVIERLDLVGAARRIGEVLASRLDALRSAHAAVGDVRGRGAMHALEFVRPGTKEPDAAAARAVAARCHQDGVLVLLCGTYGNVLRLLPPLVISEELLEEGLAVLGESVAAL